MDQDIKINRNIKNLIYDYSNTFSIWDKDKISNRLKKEWNNQFDALIENEKKITNRLLKKLD